MKNLLTLLRKKGTEELNTFLINICNDNSNNNIFTDINLIKYLNNNSLININIILRSKLLNFPPDDILPQLIPINYRLNHTLTQAAKASSFSEANESLQTTIYSDLVQAIYRDYKEKEKSIDKIEQLQQEWFIQSLFAILAGYPFHIGTFLTYIVFRLQETENLRIIFETKWKGIDLKFARDQLIYFK